MFPMKKEIFLCAINNVLSGSCDQDCQFCTQSVRYRANIERYNYKSIDKIVQEALIAKSYGALGYCLVTAGVGLDDKKTEFIAKVARAIKSEIEGLNLIACNGLASVEQLRVLQESGVDSYNHNLESSKAYYEKICTTHSWQERYQTCLNVKEVGLKLCSGGIFGMGESEEDRVSLIEAIASLEPEAVPLNFYHPNPALPIKERNISMVEGLKVIHTMREKLGVEKLLMVAGGRELMFKEHTKEMFEAGANAIVIGNYLTTQGEIPSTDREMIHALGYGVASSCEAKD